ncbi:hypothetical protein [Aquitalea aquatilis]|uniref:hypothetical protein n=1 Tax=Aquitalea aquatilis TaxID=1537400 RepID=UPI0010BCFAC4|nr:hypothetical protein [Aquitalea aquatilis]
MSEKIEKIKPMIHDATPSWNGFNYQGKVGLYVCLCTINEKIKNDKLFGDELHKFFYGYRIEYEWIEDFSLKKDEDYISIHQVKHYKETDFSSYKDAIETIVTRKLGLISTSELKPYLKKLPDGKPEDVIQHFIKELQLKKIIGKDYSVQNDWESKIALLEHDFQSVAHDFLFSLVKLHQSAYAKNVPVYVHSCNRIAKPKLQLDQYEWKLDSTGKALSDKGLDDFDIIISDRSGVGFTLALNDEDLYRNIKSLIHEIRKAIQPTSCGMQSDESMDCYIAAMLCEIDRHIVNRHKAFNKVKDIASSSNTPELLRLSVLTKILEKNYQVQNEEYFALRAKLILENTINSHVAKLNEIIELKRTAGKCFNQEIVKVDRIEQFRLDVVSRMSPRDLLVNLERTSPDKKKIEPYDLYFPGIIQDHGIKKVFLGFFELLENFPTGFVATSPVGEKFSPSCIDACHDDLDADDAYRLVAKDIVDACDSNAYVDALLYEFNYIAIKADDNGDVRCEILPPKFDDVVTDRKDGAPIFHEKKKTKLINYKSAAKIVNGDL